MVFTLHAVYANGFSIGMLLIWNALAVNSNYQQVSDLATMHFFLLCYLVFYVLFKIIQSTWKIGLQKPTMAPDSAKPRSSDSDDLSLASNSLLV